MQTYLNLIKHRSQNRLLAWLSAIWARRESARFQAVETFCLFLGHARSGHSLVGALIDAHPQAIIAHELNALRYVEAGFDRSQIYAMILRNSQAHARAGRQWTGYSYAVPGQWQGRAQQIRVIGDKRGRATSLTLNRQPDLAERLQSTVRDRVRFVHVVRNPFDNISTMARRNQKSLSHNIQTYFLICEAVQGIKERSDGSSVLSLRHESFINSPVESLQQVCDHLSLACHDDYAHACSQIIYQSPHQSREKIEWPSEGRARVDEGIARFDFLDGYTFEN